MRDAHGSGTLAVLTAILTAGVPASGAGAGQAARAISVRPTAAAAATASGSRAVAQCSGSPAHNGTDLFFGGPARTIGGLRHRGAVLEINAGTGRVRWKTALPNGVIGSPTLDGGGVLAVGTYDNSAMRNETYLVSAATGTLIRALWPGRDFAQSVFANGSLFTANDAGVAWGPASPPVSRPYR